MGGFFSFLAVFTTERIRDPHVSMTALHTVRYAHIRYQRTVLPGAFSGRRVCLCGCGLFSEGGSGGGGADIRGRGEMNSKDPGVFTIKKSNRLKGRGGGKGQI